MNSYSTMNPYNYILTTFIYTFYEKNYVYINVNVIV